MDNDIKEMIQKARKELEKEIQGYVEKYSLEESYNDKCPGCGKETTVYQSKYDDNIIISVCWDCNKLENHISIDSSHENICSICDQLIKYQDEDKNNYIFCSHDDCNQKVHKTCVEQNICNICRVWACDDHYKNYIKCDSCGILHKDNCINEIGGTSSFEKTEYVCNRCFYDEDIINEIKRPLEKYKDAINSIDENRNFYIGEAMENFDLTIMVTHLIKNENPFETLTKILGEKKLIASETGYYGHTHKTKSVCFADLTIRGLKRHSDNYSKFGVGFLKGLIFKKNGAPALYIRDNLLSTDAVKDDIKPYTNKINISRFDFHHEREWRVPDDLEFEYNEVFVVFAPTRYHDDLRNQFSDIPRFLDLDILQLI
ncbi:MAG: hypothetical protein CVV28_05040 [Methanobacteriales archaeon HGW-Methanobacteriales-1]|jgi:hypothetical protein|nr:MAG: hypothetical protein CVV28_05040 [Methanobacteriales archaeon HGW-Methanobacteriales-1]